MILFVFMFTQIMKSVVSALRRSHFSRYLLELLLSLFVIVFMYFIYVLFVDTFYVFPLHTVFPSHIYVLNIHVFIVVQPTFWWLSHCSRIKLSFSIIIRVCFGRIFRFLIIRHQYHVWSLASSAHCYIVLSQSHYHHFAHLRELSLVLT